MAGRRGRWFVAALQACGAVLLLSPVPGQLATWCAGLNVGGHGITAPSASDLLAHRHQRRKTGTASERHGCAAAAVMLPDLDGIRLAILGLHNYRDNTAVHLHASGPMCDAIHGPAKPVINGQRLIDRPPAASGSTRLAGVIQAPMHTPESYNALGDRPPRRVGQVSDVVDGILFPESSPTSPARSPRSRRPARRSLTAPVLDWSPGALVVCDPSGCTASTWHRRRVSRQLARPEDMAGRPPIKLGWS